MRYVQPGLCLLTTLFIIGSDCRAQQKGTASPAATSTPTATQTTAASQSQVDSIQTQINKINSDLQGQQNSDFGVTLGIGSLVINPGITDYSNQSNVLQANNLGSATPQYLIGISMRTQIPNFRHFNPKGCSSGANVQTKSASSKPANKTSTSNSSGGATSPPSGQATTPAVTPNPNQPQDGTSTTPQVPVPDDNSNIACQVWRRRPWEAFISLKFAPQSSQTINGYVIGGSYGFAHYIDAMIGFALTPINEPAPGFRIAASNFVTQQQINGLDLNFNATAMRNNAKNAFDGFPLADANGKLIYTGNALEVDYRGGAVFGVSVPINFSSLFSTKSP